MFDSYEATFQIQHFADLAFDSGIVHLAFSFCRLCLHFDSCQIVIL